MNHLQIVLNILLVKYISLVNSQCFFNPNSHLCVNGSSNFNGEYIYKECKENETYFENGNSTLQYNEKSNQWYFFSDFDEKYMLATCNETNIILDCYYWNISDDGNSYYFDDKFVITNGSCIEDVEHSLTTTSVYTTNIGCNNEYGDSYCLESTNDDSNNSLLIYGQYIYNGCNQGTPYFAHFNYSDIFLIFANKSGPWVIVSSNNLTEELYAFCTQQNLTECNQNWFVFVNNDYVKDDNIISHSCDNPILASTSSPIVTDFTTTTSALLTSLTPTTTTTLSETTTTLSETTTTLPEISTTLSEASTTLSEASTTLSEASTTLSEASTTLSETTTSTTTTTTTTTSPLTTTKTDILINSTVPIGLQDEKNGNKKEFVHSTSFYVMIAILIAFVIISIFICIILYQKSKSNKSRGSKLETNDDDDIFNEQNHLYNKSQPMANKSLYNNEQQQIIPLQSDDDDNY